MSSKSVKSNDERVAQFCSVTGAPVKDAVKFIQKFKRVDVAIDAFYNDPNAMASASQAKSRGSQAAQQSSSQLNAIFDRYKDQDGDYIGVDGTMKLCEDLDVNPENVVLLAIAYELKSPGVGEWPRKGWMEGWKALNCDTIASMKAALPRLLQKLGSDSAYFVKVYNYTFEFAKSEGQRSVATDTACAFWSLLLPHGLQGHALSHQIISQDEDGDESMEDSPNEEGWQPEHTDMWFEFMSEKGGKGVSKDTWLMLPEFIRTIDSKFAKHDEEAAWPSTIDDFVLWVRERNQR